LEKAYNKAYVELQRLQSGIRDRQKQKDNFLNIIREYEITIADGNNEIIHHRARINELYNEELADNPINLDEYDLPSRKTEIENLQLSLERIGPVNLAVADEYERESERYKFLTDQYIDLQQAEKTINDTIEKLDGEAQKKFMDTFTAIQENFTKTYSLFFVGGEGHLRLVGENDPLEAEIEIIAQPPGKKTQTLRMLSAGEKALTAIALLFAIYLVKPSPFCILDEVDAPLDDTNIAKFAKVLKEFSNKTQFIVVTHNKLTMEKADYMYGVTQVEEGVSKIVSVKFSSEKLKEMA
jgi:chromosome segregation protein